MKRTWISSAAVLIVALAAWLVLREPDRPGTPRADTPPRAAEASPPGQPLQSLDAGAERVPAPGADEEREGAVLILRVVDAGSGLPVEGALAAVDAAGGASDPDFRWEVLRNASGETDVRTGADGAARIELPSSVRLRLLVRRAGGERGARDLALAALEPGEQRRLLVELPRGLDLDRWIRVVGGSDGTPVEGAAVRLALPARPQEGVDPSLPVLTGSDGLAHLRAPSWTAAVVRVDSRGFGPRLAALQPGHDDPSRPQEIPLGAAASVSVHVTSSPGVPLSGATLVLATPAPEIAVPRGSALPGPDPEWTGETDAEGRCRIAELPAEVPLRVEVHRGERLLHRGADALLLPPGEETELEIGIGGSVRLHGTLIGPSSKGLAGVGIWLTRVPRGSGSVPLDRYFRTGSLDQPFALARTDEQGRFAFDGLEPGDWWVGPAPDPVTPGEPATDPLGSEVPARASFVRVPPGTDEIEVLLDGGTGSWIRGRVVGADGVAIALTVVEATPVDALGAVATRTRPDGSFALGPLAAGSFRVRARGRWGMADSEERIVRGGESDVLLKLAPGAVLRGRVVDGASGAACVATLLLVGAAGDPPAAVASSGRDGTFEFAALLPGTYDLVARSADGGVGVARAVNVRAGEATTGIVVAVQPGGKLRLRHRGPDGWGRFTVLQAGTVLASGALRAGTSVLVAVPAGDVSVVFQPPGGTEVAREVRADAGGETEVVFESE